MRFYRRDACLHHLFDVSVRGNTHLVVSKGFYIATIFPIQTISNFGVRRIYLSTQLCQIKPP